MSRVSGARVCIVTTCAAVLCAAAYLYVERKAIVEYWYLHNLKSDNKEEVLGAIRELGLLKSTRAVPQLVALLSLRDTEIVLKAVNALCAIGEFDKAGQAIVDLALGATDAWVRNDCRMAVRKMGVASVPHLARALKSRVSETREYAMRLVGEMDESVADLVPVLIAVIGSEENGESCYKRGYPAMRALRQLCKARMTKCVAGLLDDKYCVRFWCAWALAHCDVIAEEGLTILFAAATANKEERGFEVEQLRREAIRAISKIAMSNQLSPYRFHLGRICEFANDEEAEIRACVAVVIGAIGLGECYAEEVLRRLLNDEDEEVRRAASRALDRLRK